MRLVAGRFEVAELLGRGAAGEVYRAHDRETGADVAIKIARDDMPADDAAHRFEREAAALSVLSSPHVVNIIAAGNDETTTYIAMELLVGKDLAAVLEEHGPLPPEEVAGWLHQAAEALGLAHGIGIVHRDLKPANLFLDEKLGVRLVKVLDFGLAKDEDSFGATDACVGTPMYMAPEQVRGHSARVGPATDVWAIGMLAVTLLTGETYWNHGPMSEILDAIDGAPLYPPSSRWRHLPRAFDTWFQRSCQRVAERRFRSVFEQAGALATALRVELPPAGVHVPSGPMPSSHLSLRSFGVTTPAATGLIGRQVEHRAIEAQLALPGCLITITGPPGCGKSRLARAVCDTIGDQLPGGAWHVPLGAVADGTAIPDAIALALGLQLDGATSVMGQVAAELGRRTPIVVLLDCVEHLADASGLIGDLRAAAPQVSWLVTSRVPLGIPGEDRFALENLDTPPGLERVNADEARGYTAVQLFISRVRRIHPEFELTDDNVDPIVEICRRLGGAPLAIELAAARVHAVPLAEIVRDLHAASSAEAVAWSYGLLAEPAAQLLRQLSLLPGAIGIDGARELAGLLGVDADRSIADLEEADLVEHTNDSPPRLMLLDSVREYAKTRTHALEETATMRRRGIAYVDALLARAEVGLSGDQAETWLQLLDGELDNVRGALTFAIREDAEMAMRMSSRLARFWYLRGHYEEGSVWIEIALATASTVPTEARRRALQAAGHLAFLRCDYDVALERLGEARAIAHETRDIAGLAAADQLLGNLARNQGHYSAARRSHLRSLSCFQSLKNHREASRAICNLVFLSWISAEPEPEADEWLDDLLKTFSELGDVEGIVWTHLARAAIRHHGGDDSGARESISVAFAESVRARFDEGIAWVLGLMGLSSLRRAQHTQAHAQLRASLRVHRRLGDLWRCASVLEALAALNVDADPARAAVLFGGAERLRERIGAPVPRCDREFVEEHRARLRAKLGERADGELARGRSLPLDALTAQAIQM